MTARKSSRARSNVATGCARPVTSGPTLAFVERVDLGTPFVELGEPLRPRAVRIRDVVDAPAEAVDLVHRVALRLRQDPHRGIERAAGGALR